jgi:hypothetical protein
VYESRYATQVRCWLTLPELVETIRVGGGIHHVPEFGRRIARMRALFAAHGVCDELNQIKDTLPGFTVSCNFEAARRKAAPGTYTRLVIMDWDGQDNPERFAAGAAAFRDELASNPLTAFAAVSPKGNGVKQLLFFDETASRELHPHATEALRKALQQKFRAAADPDCTDVSRICYFTHDPDIRVESNGRWDGHLPIWEVDTAAAMQQFPRSVSEQQATIGIAELKLLQEKDQRTLFHRYVQALAASGLTWQRGARDQMIWAVYKLGSRGVSLATITELLAAHAKQQNLPLRESDVGKLQRIWTEYGLKWFGKVTPPVVPEQQRLTLAAGEHLTKHLDTILPLLTTHHHLYLDAPTGAGKTTLIRALVERLNLQADLLMPTRALVEQQLDCAHIVGSRSLTPAERNAPLLASPYDSVAKLRRGRPHASLLVIDEAHELTTAYGYRATTIQQILEAAAGYSYVIYLSGSMFPLLPRSGSLPPGYVKVERTGANRRPYSLVPPRPKEPARHYFLHTLKPGLNVFYCNDKSELGTLEVLLRERGLRVALVHAERNTSGEYVDMLTNQSLRNYDVLLCTRLLQSGVNVLDEDRPVRIVFAPNCQLADYIQFPARWRKVLAQVEILHHGQLGEMVNDDPLGLRARQIAANVQELNRLREEQQASQALYTLHGLADSQFLSAGDGILEQSTGAFVVCPQYPLWQRYERECVNASRNADRLRQVLASHGFEEVPCSPVDTELSTGEQARSQDLKQAAKQVRQQARLTFATTLLDPSAALPVELTQDQLDIRRRLEQLFRLEPDYAAAGSIERQHLPATLVSAARFAVLWDQRLFAALRAHDEAGTLPTLRPKTHRYYERLKAFAQHLSPGRHTTCALRQQLRELGFAVQDAKMVRHTLCTLVASKPVRWRLESDPTVRVHGYEIGGPHRSSALSTSGQSAPLDFLDFLL